jgi:hypothetical protein
MYEVEDLAQEFISLGILTETNLDDCKHIAVAMLANCDIIVSWNFKHIVNYKTIEGVKLIAGIKGYKDIVILCPSMFLGGYNESKT